MDTGAFDGIRQEEVTLPPEKVFCWTYDQEDDAYYGRSRHENIRSAWWAWMELLRKEGQYIAKVAGVTPVITYPEGTGKDAYGADQPNHVLAWQVLQNLGRGNGVAMPNRLAPRGRKRVGDARGGPGCSWRRGEIRVHGVAGGAWRGFCSSKMQHKETLMLQGWLVPERAVAEAAFRDEGGGGEPRGHGGGDRASMTCSICCRRRSNENVVDPLLALNFGAEARGLVTVSANPLIDDKAVLARTIVQTVLTAPFTELLLKVLSFDAMLEQQGLPVTGAGAGVGEGEDREGQAREGELQVGDGGGGGEGSEDAQGSGVGAGG